MTKRLKLMLLLTSAVLGSSTQASCRGVADSSARKRAEPAAVERGDSPCERWRQNVSQLTPSEAARLQREGAIMHPHTLISERLVADCELRGEMSAYFARMLAGKTEEADRRFASGRSPEVVQTLRQLWPTLSGSAALIGDGDSGGQKYNLLADPALKEAALAPFVSDVLEKEGMTGPLAFAMFSRPPMPELKSALRRQVEGEASKADTPQRVYCLALLYNLGEPSAPVKLKTLAGGKSLSETERAVVSSVLGKMGRGETLKFADVEDLEYQP